jgi:phage portal protein BeeE
MHFMEEMLAQVDARHAMMVVPEKASSSAIGSAIQANQFGDVWGQESMLQATEQYKHFRGRPYAPAKLKAQRISGQPLHVARKAKSKGKREAGTKSVLDVLRNVGGVRQEAERVRAMLQFMPESIKMAPEGWEVVEDEHPIQLAMQSPNPAMGEGKLVENTVLSLEMTGRAYQHIRKLSKPDSDGRKFHIWYYPASWVSAIHKPELFAAFSVQVSGGLGKIEVPGNEMVYFHYSDPSDPLGAIGPLQAMAADVVADEAISETQRNAFINAVWPSLMFIMGKHPAMKSIGGLGSQDMGRPLLTAEQRREMTIWIKQMFRGWKKAGEPIIIDGMFEDVKPVYNSIREMDFLKSAGLKESQINKGYTVNPISMGGIESANRASASMAEDHLVGNALNPIVRLYNSGIARKYPAMMAPGETILIWLEPCRPTDREMDVLEKKVRLASGTRFYNEWRQEQGDEPVEDMKDVIVTAQGLMTKEMVLAGIGSASGSINQTPAGVPNDPVNGQTGKMANRRVRKFGKDEFGEVDTLTEIEFDGEVAVSKKVKTLQKDAFGEVESIIEEIFDDPELPVSRKSIKRLKKNDAGELETIVEEFFGD